MDGDGGRQRGASQVEIALLIALVAVVALAGLRILGAASSDEIDVAATAVDAPPDPSAPGPGAGGPGSGGPAVGGPGAGAPGGGGPEAGPAPEVPPTIAPPSAPPSSTPPTTAPPDGPPDGGSPADSPPADSPPADSPPAAPDPGRTSWSGVDTRVTGSVWRGTASLELFGIDGAPLVADDAFVVVRETVVYELLGEVVEIPRIVRIPVVDGVAAVATGPLRVTAAGWHLPVSAVRYEVLGIDHATTPDVAWDGSAPGLLFERP